MIIRISDARIPGDPGSKAWWNEARRSAARGEAPHGIALLVLDSSITHIDVFVSESGEVWRWAEQFEGWTVDGRTQLKSEPLESQRSAASEATASQLRGFPSMRHQRS
jgi:hypothetical protein